MTRPGRAPGVHAVTSLAGSVALFLAIVAAVFARAMQLCHGHFGYPMDDTYIHMAIAKNFALHGVWGVTRYAFSSSTSSPLYTLLLAGVYWVSGVHEVIPLLLNLGAGIALLALTQRLLQEAGLSNFRIFVTLAAVVLLMPLPAVVEGGMEHVLHAILTLAFVHLTCLALMNRASNGFMKWLFVLAPVLVMTRYEGLFLVFAAGVMLMAQRRWLATVLLGAAAFLPLAIYGGLSVREGWLPLPNSILLKANVPHGSVSMPAFRFLWNWALAGVKAPHIAFLLLTALVLLYLRWRQDRTIWNYPSLALIQFLVIGFLHLELARTGWFYRYEAYLVATGIFTCAIGSQDLQLQPLSLGPRSWAFGVGYAAGVLAILTLGFKSYRSMAFGPRAFHNIYEQQFQMARFVGKYYPTETIVLNDIGAVCFFTDARALDVYGLGSMEPARAKLRNGYNTEWLREWAMREHARVAILYPTGWAGESFAIPLAWVPVATWSLSDNFVLAGDAVKILAVEPEVEPMLERNISLFQGSLPPEIVVSSNLPK